MKTSSMYSTFIQSNVEGICNTVNDILNYLESICSIKNEDILFELKVILNELLINAVKHGNREMPEKQVKINLGITCNGYVFIIVEDEGDGYDYECIIKRGVYSFDIDQIQEDGRGIFIVKNLCDCVKFNNKGNKVVILKKLNA